MIETESQRDLETFTVTAQAVMKQAQQKLMEMKGQNIHGKDYKTVAIRVKVFREFFPEYAIKTNILEKTPDHISMVAEIRTPANRLVASGHAEEDKETNMVNMTSMLENCETSAVGRALAVFGLAGDEMASANEIERAKEKERQATGKKATERIIKNNG